MCHPSWGGALAQRERDLARLCRIRGRIDWQYAQPLDAEALAAEGMPPCAAKQVTRPLRDREALVMKPPVA